MRTLRQSLRGFAPLALRQAVAHRHRVFRDWRDRVRFDRDRVEDLSGLHLVTGVTQPVMPSALFENKLANLANGARHISRTRIAPGGVWSFWNAVGPPTVSNGFVVGRNLVDGVLTRQVGGGLCQPSSLLYHVGLLAGLTVVERHPHSIDIYEETDRFTPLGADATVVWGYKDLRLANPHGAEIVFECYVEGRTITARVHAGRPLPARDVRFVREAAAPSQVLVTTRVDGAPLDRTVYEQRQGMGLAPA